MKLAVVKAASHIEDHDLPVFTETWLKPDKLSTELIDDRRFEVFRADRRDLQKKRDGGVLVAVNYKYSVRKIDIESISNAVTQVDILAVNVHLGHRRLVIVALYILPDVATGVFKSLFELIIENIDINVENLLVVGDFNVPRFVVTDCGLLEVKR